MAQSLKQQKTSLVDEVVNEQSLYDDETKGQPQNVTLFPANPGDRAFELALADGNHSEDPDFDVQLDTVRRIQQMQTEGHIPAYSEVFAREAEERAAANIERAGVMYQNGLQDLGKQIVSDTMHERDRIASGVSTDGEKYQAVAETALSEAVLYAQEEDPQIDVTIFTPELVARAAQDRTTGALLEDAMQETIRYLQNEYDQSSAPGQIVDTLGNLFDFTKHVGIRKIVDSYIDDPQVLGAWHNWLHGMNHYDQIAAFGLLLRTVEPADQLRILEDVTKNKFGFLGLSHNPKSTIEFLEAAKSYSIGDAAMANIFRVLDATVVADVGLLLKPVMAQAKMAAVTSRLLGAKEGGRVMGRQITDLKVKDVDTVKHLDKTAEAPYLDNTLEQRGVTEGMKEELHKEAIEFMDKYQAMLLDKGIDEPTVAQMIKDMSSKITDPGIRKELRGVILGDPKAGLSSQVLWQAPNGRSFATREAAEHWAKSQGFKEYEVISPRDPLSGDVITDPDMVAQALEQTERDSARLALIRKADALKKQAQVETAEIEDGVEFFMSDELSGTWKETLEDVEFDALRNHHNVKASIENAKRFVPEHAEKLEELAIEIADFRGFVNTLKQRQLSDPDLIDNVLMEWADVTRKFDEAAFEVRLAELGAVQRTLDTLGATPGSGLTVSPALRGSRIEGALNSLRKTYGVEGDLVVFTAKETDELNLILKPTGPTRGTALRYDMPDRSVSMIMLDDSMSLSKQVRTLAHEFGHIVDFNALKQNPALRNEMMAHFNEWSKKFKGVDWKAAALERNTSNISPRVRTALKVTQSPDDFFKLLNSANYRKWQESFSEWWADQFAKHAFTNVRSTSALSQFFKASVKRMSEVYRALAKSLGLGNTDEFKNPVKAVREMLDDHVERVARGEGSELLTDAMRGDLDFTNLSDEIDPTPVKPRIKAKVDAVAKASQQITREQFRDAQGYIVRTSVDTKRPVYDEDSFRGLDSGLWVSRILSDPKSKVIPELFSEGVIKEYGEERILELFRRYQKRVLPRDKESLQAIEGLLARGDAYSDPKGGKGKIFSVQEILSTPGLTTPEVIKGYYGMVQMRKLMHHIHNQTLVKELRARGFLEYKIKTQVRSPDPLDNRDHLVHAQKINMTSDLYGKRAYDAASGAPVELSQELFDQLIQEGGYLTRLRRPKHLTNDGVRDEYMVVDTTALSNNVDVSEIQQALGYRPGEIARYYTDPFFIDLKFAGAVDEVLTGSTFKYTIRTAPDATTAKAYVESMNEALEKARQWRAGNFDGNIAQEIHRLIGSHSDADGFFKAFREGDFDGAEEFSFRFDRQDKDDLFSIHDLSEGTGGVLRSSRQGRLNTFDFQVDPSRTNIAAPYESLLQEARTVSRYSSTYDLRTKQIEKFINTFGDLFPESIVDGDPYLTWRRIEDRDLALSGTRRSIVAENAKRYLSEHLGVLDKEELVHTNSIVDRMIQWQLNYGEKNGSKLKKIIADMVLGKIQKNRTPVNWLRGLNFNLKLGMWNPAQLFVQAQGGVTALGISPKNGFKAWSRAIAYRMAADSLDNEAVLAKLGAALGKAGGKVTGVSPQELREVVTALKNSGILSNMAMTAFHNTDTLGKLRNANAEGLAGHRFFYNRGEEFTRITSWETSRLDWIAKNPGLDWRTPSAQREILATADDYMLNMTKANRARWQKGLPSIPLQFLQWNIKFHNQLIRGIAGGRSTFTRTQAARLLGLHYLAYGTRGNALGNFIEAAIPEGAFEALGDGSDEGKLAVTQGAFALVVKQFLEEGVGTGDDTANIALGSRLGTTRWIQDIVEGVAAGGSPFLEIALGPSGSIVEDIGSLGRSVPRAIVHSLGSQSDRLAHIVSMFYPGGDTPSYRLLFEQGNTNLANWGEVLNDLSEVSSGLSNVSKAYMWHQMGGWALNPQGAKVAKVTTAEIVGKAIFGANPQSVEDTWVLYRNQKDYDTAMNDIAKRIAELQNDEMRAWIAGNDDYAKEKSRQWRMLYSSFTPDDQSAIREKLIDPHGFNDSLREKLIKDFFYRPDKYETGVQTDNLE